MILSADFVAEIITSLSYYFCRSRLKKSSTARPSTEQRVSFGEAFRLDNHSAYANYPTASARARKNTGTGGGAVVNGSESELGLRQHGSYDEGIRLAAYPSAKNGYQGGGYPAAKRYDEETPRATFESQR